MSKPKIIFAILFALVSLVLYVLIASFIAGYVLFIVFKQIPVNISFFTIYDAFQTFQEPHIKKVYIALAVGYIAPAAAFVAMLLTGKKGPELYGKTRFANRSDLNKEGFLNNKGIILGRLKKDFLKLPGYEFVMLAAATRTGKGVGFVIPNLLTFPDSTVVLDIKGENYQITSQFRKRHLKNKIYYFNPFSENSHRWNPLSYISDDEKFRVNDIMNLANMIFPSNSGNDNDAFWNDMARDFFLGVVLLVFETPSLPNTLGEVVRQASGKGQKTVDYLNSVIALRKESELPLSNRCVNALNRVLTGSENSIGNILQTFNAKLSRWENAVVDKATSGDDFDLREVRKKKMSIYIHIDPANIVQADFLINLFFTQLINENVKELPEQNPALKYQCLLMLDEFTAAGKISIIAKGVGFMAGYNMRLALIIQDKTQLESTYGKDAENLISNLGAVIYYTPRKVKEAEEYSKMIGYNTIKSKSVQRSFSQSGRSETESQQQRALMLPQELLSLSIEKELISRPGIPIILSEKIRYFKEDYFKERLAAVDCEDVQIDGTTRTIPIKEVVPKPNWRIYKSSVYRSDYYQEGEFMDLKKPEQSPDMQKLLDIVNEEDTGNDSPESEQARIEAVEKLAEAYKKEYLEKLDTPYMGTSDTTLDPNA